MASKDPEIVHCTDDHNRTALHYAIFNKNQKQVDITRTLLELKCDINAVDEERKTALHHASESNKARLIPILVQSGASLIIRERTNRKTPLQAAANDRIRELILLYSDPDNDQIKQEKAKLELIKPTKEYNKDSMKPGRDNLFDEYKPGVQGTRTDFPTKKTTNMKKKTKPAVEESKAYYDQLEELEGKGILPFDLRNHRAKLIKLMRKVQEYGIKHDLHKKKKFIFSGSWMEKVDDISDLMASLFQTNSSETALKIFNVLNPYDKPLPAIDEEDDEMKEFYGVDRKNQFEAKGSQNVPESFKEQMAAKGMDNLMAKSTGKPDKNQQNSDPNFEDYGDDGNMMANQRIQDLDTLLKTTEQKLNDVNKEKDDMVKALEERDNMMKALNDKVSSQNKGSTQVSEENIKQKEHIKRLLKELENTQNQHDTVKTDLQTNKQEYEKLVADIPEIKELDAIRRSMETNEKQRQLDNQRNSALRFRSGMLFQKALEKLDKGKSDDTPKPKSKDPVKSGEYYLTDDQALIRFLNTVERNQPPSLYQRLLDADNKKTGSLKKSQFTGILKDLHVTPQDVMSLQRIAGYSSGKKAVEIDEFVTIIKQRGKTRQRVEDDTFRRIQKCIRKEGWSIKETFEIFDKDGNNYIDFQEMCDGFKQLKIHVPNKHLKSVFAILDDDSNGQVSLKEFKTKIEEHEPQPKNEVDNESNEGMEPEAEGEDEEEYFRTKEEEKRAKADQDKKKSLVKEKEIEKYKKDLQKGAIDQSNDTIKNKKQNTIKKVVEEETKKAYDEKNINGELKVQASKGYNMIKLQPQGYKYFYIVFCLEGTNNDESFTSKPIEYFVQKENFQWSAKIPLLNCHPDELGEELNLKFYASKDNFENADFVGEIF